MPGNITIGRNSYNSGWLGTRKFWAMNADNQLSKSRAGHTFMRATTLAEVGRQLSLSPPDVFLSHKRDDLTSALDLAEKLSVNHSLHVYVDEIDPNVNPNDKELDDYLRSVIRNSKSLLVFVSDKTKDSWWVPFEVGVASERDKFIGTFLAAGVQLPSFLDRWWVIPTDLTLDDWAKRV